MPHEDKPKPVELSEKLTENEICPSLLLQGQEEAFARDVARLQARHNEFVRVACPACLTQAHTVAFEKWHFQYVRCVQCNTVYMSPRPPEKVMSDYYTNSENYRYWAEHIFPASEGTRREKINRPWLNHIVGLTNRFNISRGTLLEVGPGFGTFAALATNSGFFGRVLAIEPTPEMAAACRERGINVIEKRIEDVMDEVSQKADVSVAFEVIEHLFQPGHFLRQCARLLKAGGLLVLSCPNEQGFDISTLGPISLAVDPEHVNLFNPHSLRLLVETCGFDVLEVTTPGRLDAEFVHDAIEQGRYDVSSQPFLKRILVDEWDRLGWPFQQFLAENDLSSHMWLAAQKRQI